MPGGSEGRGRRGVPITRSVALGPGTTDWCHTISRVLDDHLGCFASERSQQAPHDGVLRRTELFGAAISEATENSKRGQTGLGHQPAFDVGEVRIEH
jgi:hypothetical protein